MVVLRTHPEAEDVVDLDAGDVVGELEERDHLVLLRPPSASAPVRQPSPPPYTHGTDEGQVYVIREVARIVCVTNTQRPKPD